jgi:hypothetical protein
MCNSLRKYRIHFVLDESEMKYDLTTKYKSSDPIDIGIVETSENTEPFRRQLGERHADANALDLRRYMRHVRALDSPQVRDNGMLTEIAP